jgi:uncharacterized membrane protein YqhA
MNRYFTALSSLRYLAVVAVTGAFLGSALMFLLGATDVVNAYLTFFGSKAPDGELEAGEASMIILVASVDHFLFATILMIFGIGIYALIFGTGAPSSHGQNGHGHKSGSHNTSHKLSSWNHLKNLGGMDEMLLKVIIMLLSVSFLEFVLHAGMGSLDWTSLVIPAAVLALGLCLRWMGASSDATEDNEMRRDELDVKALQAQSTQISAALDELERLVALHEKEVLDDAEFASMRAKLVSK